MRAILAVIVVLSLVAVVDATEVNRLTSADARIYSGDPDANFGDEMGTCATGRDSSAVLWAWDFSDLAGETVTSDGTFNLFCYWIQSGLGMTLYELTGGAFDEMTVTYNNYVGAGTLDDIVGDPLLTTYQAGGSWFELTIPQATLQGMVDGTIAGLATRNPVGEYWNHCQATREREFHEMPERRTPPYLVFETAGGSQLPGDANGDGSVTDADYTIWADNYGDTGASFDMGDFNGDGEVTDADYTIWADNYGATSRAIPEPATLSLVGLSALALLRRRK